MTGERESTTKRPQPKATQKKQNYGKEMDDGHRANGVVTWPSTLALLLSAAALSLRRSHAAFASADSQLAAA